MTKTPARKRVVKRSWYGHLWREWTIESVRPITPVSFVPQPRTWSDAQLTVAWLGHSTVLINFFGINIITDPVLFPRIGVRLPGFTIGPKRLTAPALHASQLPRIDLVLLSHAHFDHLDTRTLHRFGRNTAAITAHRTGDLLRHMRFGSCTELRWNQAMEIKCTAGGLKVRAFRVNHWGARLRTDHRRSYNGYVLERNGRRLIFGGDTAITDTFAKLNDGTPYDLAMMAIGAYDPWIRAHATPEQVIEMCDAAGARFILPIHHQTFRLSFEPSLEPIERFQRALRKTPERIALSEIGQTFVLPE